MAAPKASVSATNAPAAGTPAASKTPVSPSAAAGIPAAGVPAADTVGRLSAVPVPELSAKAWMTLDANSGQVIAALNPDEPIEPASLTKLMSAYVVFEALDNKRLTLNQTVNISEAAWKTEGSRTFVKLNTQVSIDDLLQGLIVQSGNDATVALAEAVAGSESAFATLMNQEGARMGLKGTHYVN
ncbi:MAG: serine hydrolase, partial [Burkholderiaceae bacterium]